MDVLRIPQLVNKLRFLVKKFWKKFQKRLTFNFFVKNLDYVSKQTCQNCGFVSCHFAQKDSAHVN